MIVCICRAVPDRVIRTVIERGANSIEAIGAACRAGTGCGACREMLADMLVKPPSQNPP